MDTLFLSIITLLLLFIFVPTFDLYIINTQTAKCLNKCRCLSSICNKRDIKVNGGSAYLISVIQLFLS